MRKIGFTHGALYRLPNKFSPEAFTAYAESGSEILEICWNNLAEADRLMDVVPFAKKYARTSIHLPSDVRYADDEVTKTALDKAFELYQAIGAELVVVHPDRIESTALFGQYPMNYAAENMDCRKKAYKNVS